MIEILHYEFMRNALMAAILVSVTCGIVGTYVVIKRIVFISGGISHAAFGGIGLGYLLGINPILTAIPFSILAALGIGTISKKTKVSEDTAIGILWTVGMALGVIFIALSPGYAPDLLYWLSPDLAIRYRYTLYISGAMTLLAAIPALMIRDDMLPKTKKITLRPYLWGMDSFTVKIALIELFVGLTMGLVTPFMNVFFIYRLGTSREFFGTIAALALVPITAATALGPIIATRMGNIRAVIALRFLIPLCTVTMAMTTYPLLGTAAYWAYRALFMVSQSIWFAFAMETATPKAKVAASAWLEITFWIGMGLAARVTGIFFAQSNYALPFYISSIAAVLTGLLTQILVSSYHAPVSSVDKPARRT